MIRLEGKSGSYSERESSWELQKQGGPSTRHGARFDAAGNFTGQRRYIAGQRRSEPGSFFSQAQIKEMEKELKAAIRGGIDNLPALGSGN